jgi:NADH-quinone oxidoreductase subunit G
MGALTLKSFPFELRGWDIEKFESIDPTDGFGSNTRVYINKDQVIQIEPDYDVQTFNTWLTDKGRQFFDGIFGTWSLTKKSMSVDKNNSITDILAVLIKNIYMLEHCNKQRSNKKFFTIVFENLSIEVVSLLLMFSKNYSFIKLKRAENNNNKNDLESNFQLNSEINRINLMNSDLCLLLSTNTRYEGYYLNLNLRQRFLKGNFKCFILGSCVDLTFPTKFIGSNIKIFKDILEGNHSICQDLKIAKNPLLILPNDLIKRDDVKNIIEILNNLLNLILPGIIIMF